MLKRLPGAVWTGGASQGLPFTAAATDHPKGCLHTTETGSWPSYADWSVAPHLTVMPRPGKGVDVRQHIEFDTAAFALRSLPGGAQTNRERVYQIELVGSCSRSFAEKHGYFFWPDADDAVLRDLYATVIEPMARGLGIGIDALRFQSYDASYGPRGQTNTVRLGASAWEDYRGWLGHQHAPENLHGDPGAFPWDRMIRLSQEDEVPTQAEWDAHEKQVAALATAVADLTRLVTAVPATTWKVEIDAVGAAGTQPASAMLRRIDGNIWGADSKLNKIHLDVSAIGAAVAKDAPGLTGEQVERVAVIVAREVIAAVGDALLTEAGHRLMTPGPGA
jgi:hypothetical protein